MAHPGRFHPERQKRHDSGRRQRNPRKVDRAMRGRYRDPQGAGELHCHGDSERDALE